MESAMPELSLDASLASRATADTTRTARNDTVPLGRWVGAGLLLSFALGMYSNFKLQSDLFGGKGFLWQADTQTLRIGSIVTLDLVCGLISIIVAVLIYRYSSKRSPVLALCYLLLAAAGAAVVQIEDATLLAMQPLSHAFVSAGADAAAQFEPARQLLRGLRNGIHFPDKLMGGCSVLLFYFLLLRSRAVPASLAALGMVASFLQMFSVGQELFGFDVNYFLLAPLALVYLLTGLWLLWRGLAETSLSQAISGE
jgi:hypothetical protein